MILIPELRLQDRSAHWVVWLADPEDDDDDDDLNIELTARNCLLYVSNGLHNG